MFVKKKTDFEDNNIQKKLDYFDVKTKQNMFYAEQ